MLEIQFVIVRIIFNVFVQVKFFTYFFSELFLIEENIQYLLPFSQNYFQDFEIFESNIVIFFHTYIYSLLILYIYVFMFFERTKKLKHVLEKRTVRYRSKLSKTIRSQYHGLTIDQILNVDETYSKNYISQYIKVIENILIQSLHMVIHI